MRSAEGSQLGLFSQLGCHADHPSDWDREDDTRARFSQIARYVLYEGDGGLHLFVVIDHTEDGLVVGP